MSESSAVDRLVELCTTYALRVKELEKELDIERYRNQMLEEEKEKLIERIKNEN